MIFNSDHLLMAFGFETTPQRFLRYPRIRLVRDIAEVTILIYFILITDAITQWYSMRHSRGVPMVNLAALDSDDRVRSCCLLAPQQRGQFYSLSR